MANLLRSTLSRSTLTRNRFMTIMEQRSTVVSTITSIGSIFPSHVSSTNMNSMNTQVSISLSRKVRY